jgi:hypothetical protein
VRAGPYALYQGREYRCGSPRSPRIRLFADGDLPCPDGFEPDDGDWTRLVDRQDVDRLTVVSTVAVWHERQVKVTEVSDDATEALVEGRSWPPPDAPEAYVVENGLWHARVPAGALTQVVETAVDFPVDWSGP